MFTVNLKYYSRVLRACVLVISILILTFQVEVMAKEIVGDKNFTKPSPPANHARAAALIDVTSGRILFSQRGDERMLIASLTKIMTAIVAIEEGELDNLVKVSTRAAGKEGSSLYLKPGEKISLHNVIYGLMLRSGNDAAVAIAEHVGGSVEGFAFLMNKKAEEIGLENSHFMNPHGLDEQGHYSSANDLAKLTAYAMHNEHFREIVSTRVKSVPNPHEAWDYKWVNKNKMLRMYDGADGVKTGYTKKALRCLVSSATRNGQQLVAVTINDGDDWYDHRNLLDFGFANYPLLEIIKSGDPIVDQPYQVHTGFSYPFAAGERDQLVMRLAPSSEKTPAHRLGYRGQLQFFLNEKQIGSVPLIPSQLNILDKPSYSSFESSSSESNHLISSIRGSLRALFLQGGTSSW